jgi:predicted  nucleic acid-binding Zn-ribbon protein
MLKGGRCLSLNLVLALLLGSTILTVLPIGAQPDLSRVDPLLLREVTLRGSARAILVLDESLELGGRPLSQQFIVERLDAQQPLIDELLAAKVPVLRRHWLIDAITVELDRSALALVNSLHRVKAVMLDRQYQLPTPKMEPLDKLVEPLVDVGRVAVEADKMNRMGFTGTGIQVAVIDTGIQNNHPYLQRGGSSVVRAQFNADGSTVDFCHWHGTHVAGIIGSQHPRYRGVAPGADIYDVIVFCGYPGWLVAFSSDIIAGIEWSLKGPDGIAGTADDADIINMSLGSFDYPWAMRQLTQDPLVVAIDNAVKAGVIVAVAAGNLGPGGYGINVLCLARGALCVGASDDKGTPDIKDDVVASFSSRGPLPWDVVAPDIVAPGVDIISTVPTDVSPSGLRSASGTSMAAPHVAGVAALLKQASPGWLPEDVKTALMNTAADILPTYYVGPHPSEQGAGLVRALAALRAPLRAMVDGKTTFSAFLKPGQSLEKELVLVNRGVTPLSLYLNSTRFQSYLASATLPANIVTFSKTSLAVNPGSASVAFRISVPSDAAPGTYGGYITAVAGENVVKVPVMITVPLILKAGDLQATGSISTRMLGSRWEFVVFFVEVTGPSDFASFSASSRGHVVDILVFTPSGRALTGQLLPEKGLYTVILMPNPWISSWVWGETVNLDIKLLSVTPAISQTALAVSDLQQSISSMQQELQKLLSDLQQRLSALQQDLQRLSAELSALRSSVNTLEAGVANLNAKLATLTAAVSGLQSDLSNLSMGLSQVKDRVAELSNLLTETRRDVANLKVGLLQAMEQLSDVSNRLAEARSSLEAAQRTLSGRLDAVAARLSQEAGRIDTLEAQATALRSSIAQLAGRVESLQDQTTILRSSIAQLDSSLRQAERSLEVLSITLERLASQMGMSTVFSLVALVLGAVGVVGLVLAIRLRPRAVAKP